MSEQGLTVIITTTSTHKEAQGLASSLLQQKLAACINIIKIEESIYAWEGELQSEPECLLIIKTSKSLCEKTANTILEIHPYETPLVSSFDADTVNQTYLEWLMNNTNE